MIEGRVTPERQAVLSLSVRATGGQAEPSETAIDTGFTGFLTLPSDQIARLGLPWLGLKNGILADGREVVLNLFEAVVDWHGQPRRVPALEVERGALLGMALLEGSRLTLDVAEGGQVQIEPLPPA